MRLPGGLSMATAELVMDASPPRRRRRLLRYFFVGMAVLAFIIAADLLMPRRIGL